MAGNAPSVMVSSTFYDLSQIRADILSFIQDQLGYRAILSEYPSFPIDPDADTIENCRRRVEQDADVLVLVIGGRYGSIDSTSDKSITNLEYITARAKGIPVYVFVAKNIMNILPVWKSNPEGDFSSVVDSNRLFEFVEEIRSSDRAWTHEFESAQDIIATLRIQLAHLAQEGLKWRERLFNQPISELKELHGKALRVALERPEAWEYRLFGQALCDEVEANKDIRREHRLALALGIGEHVSASDFLDAWVPTRINELKNISSALEILVNNALQTALRESGTPGDPSEIVFVARRMGIVYRHAIEWSQHVRCAYVDDRFEAVRRELSLFPENIIRSIEEYGPNFLRQLEEALSAPRGNTQQVLDAQLVIDASNVEEFERELNRVEKELEDEAGQQ